MKIGILTFHSQLNYGGVLQCWALQTALENMGYEVLVIDREFEHQIRSVKAIFRGWTVKQWIKFLAKLLLRRPEALRIVRYYRTVMFVKRNLHLTSYSFKAWKDAPKDLGVDLIVVGSDQVWNGIWNNLGVYLLQGAPDVPAIGYAVSLGMIELPTDCIAMYKKAADRFISVSVREKEAAILLSQVGIKAKTVADPVLLVDWSLKYEVSDKADLVCYFIGNEILDVDTVQSLDSFAVRNHMPIHIFLQNFSAKTYHTAHVKIHYTAGPAEFCKTLAAARYIISDSFHALMFAYIFGKEIRILKPSTAGRKIMFARLREFVDKYVLGECIVASVCDALKSIELGTSMAFDNEKMRKIVVDSKTCLMDQLNIDRK